MTRNPDADARSRFNAEKAIELLETPKKMTESEEKFQTRLLQASVHASLALWFQKDAEE